MTIASSPLSTNPTAEEFAARRKLLTDALRSGQYAQTTCKLKRAVASGEHPEGFCCLGVACDVFHEATGQGKWMETDPVFGYVGFRVYEGGPESYSTLPFAVQEWFGFTYPTGAFDNGEGGDIPSDALFRLNDYNRFTFAQIADVIDSKPKGLFVE